MKKLIVIIVLCLLISCKKSIIVPDLTAVYVEDARKVVTENKLIPEIEYIFSNSVEKDYVISTEPILGSNVEENSRILLKVSKGYLYKISDNALISWIESNFQNDESWSFDLPIVKQGKIEIIVYPLLSNKQNLTFRDYCNVKYNTDNSDTFICNIDSSKYDQFNKIVINIDLKNNDFNLPTNLFIDTYFDVDGVERTTSLKFTIEW